MRAVNKTLMIFVVVILILVGTLWVYSMVKAEIEQKISSHHQPYTQPQHR